MSGPKNELRAPQRSAAPSIRGYNFQFLQTVRTWVELDSNEFLWCEGNEDLDRKLADNSWEETQFKDLSKTVTEATQLIQKTILNFLCGFVAHRKRGSYVRFVLRTTATLGNAQDPQLAPWLRGETFELSQLVAALQQLVDKHDSDKSKKDNATTALRELLSSSEERAFFDAVSWEFGECDNWDLRANLQSYVSANTRFAGVDPVLLVEQLIAKIVDTSCSEPLSQRVLTRRDLDFLVNDLLISKRCQTYNYGPDGQEKLYVGMAVGKDMCVVVVRYGNANAAKTYLETAITEAKNHPMERALDDTTIWDSHQIDDSLLKLDADFFGAISEGKPVEGLLMSLAFSARSAKARGAEKAILFWNPNITVGSSRDIKKQFDDELSEFELQESEIDVRQLLADKIAFWVLHRDVRVDQFNCKVRCFADLRNNEYFTSQTQPLLVSLLGD